MIKLVRGSRKVKNSRSYEILLIFTVEGTDRVGLMP